MDIKLKTSPSVWTLVICLAAGLAAGFWLGRKTIKTGESHDSFELPAVERSIALTPKSETVPDYPVLPMKRDTVIRHDTLLIVEKVDSAAIIRDYEIRRQYSELLFDNSQWGRLSVNFNVQYNRADSLHYSFVPIQQVNRIVIRPKLLFFGQAGYSTLGIVSAGGGVIHDNWGMGYRFQRQTASDRNGHEVSVFYFW
ncbi:MAG: hypothetical protein LBK58_16125 [Prevotellaceae bacterium]|jgi:hypothetical protein|nr:hypothetical protein [Prevotellaceae bacterium]